jgi:hypothetical protein
MKSLTRGLTIGILPFLVSCALFKELTTPPPPSGPSKVVVDTRVTAYTDENYKKDLSPSITLNFKSPNGDDVRFRSDIQEIIKSCRSAAAVLGFKTSLDEKNCTHCVNVLTMRKFERTVTAGDPQTHCASYYGKSFGSATCYTYRSMYAENDRWIGLTFFNQAGKSIHQIDAYSSGPTQSVLQVAEEMCYAALKDFPQKFENEDYSISRHLELERKQPTSKADQDVQ